MNLAPTPTRSFSAEALLITLVVGAIFLFPQSHYGYSTRILDMGDEGLLWYGSQRAGQGDVPLRDFFSYDPGRYYWSALVFKFLRKDGLFEQIIADDLFGLAGLWIVYLLMCKQEIKRRWRIAAIILLGIGMGFPRHKIYEQTLSLISVAAVTYVLSKPTARNWLYYGVATGLAAFVGRNSGLYFVVAAMMAIATLKIQQRGLPVRQAGIRYFVGGIIGYLPMFAMLVGIRGFPTALHRSILLNSKQLIPIPVPFPWRLHALGFRGLQPFAVSILFVVVPVTYGVLVILLRPQMRPASRPGNRTLAYGASIAGIPYLFHAFSYASFGHLAQASLPFVVACVALTDSVWESGERWLAVSLFASVTGLVLVCWIPRQPAVEYFRARAHYKSIQIQGTKFELINEDVDALQDAETAYQQCGAHPRSFLASPNYPSTSAFLRARSPFWEVYFIFFRLSRGDGFEDQHIQALAENQVSVVQLNRFDKRDMAKMYPKLLGYVLSHYQPMPEIGSTADFEIYYIPQMCGKQ